MDSNLRKYFEHYPINKAPFMHKQLAEWENSQPLKGTTGLHCVPVVPNTLLKIVCLIAAGMEITVVNPSFMPTDNDAYREATAHLTECGITWTDHIESLHGKEFDFYFDCGAELYQKLGAPRLGAIELTGSGDQYYRQQALTFPVLSIDRSLTKQLETVFGSATSVNLAISKLANIDPATKSWMIFGFGKIGRGIAYYCAKHTTPVVIVDQCDKAREAALALGLKVINPAHTLEMQNALLHTDIVVTATGGKNILASYPRAWFDHKILANMGVYDEFGDQFAAEDVLYKKAPVNFSLPEPTQIEFIDPEFFAHNAAVMYFLKNNLSAGVHDLLLQDDQYIIERWCESHDFTPADIHKWFVSRDVLNLYTPAQKNDTLCEIFSL